MANTHPRTFINGSEPGIRHVRNGQTGITTGHPTERQRNRRNHLPESDRKTPGPRTVDRSHGRRDHLRLSTRTPCAPNPRRNR